MLRQTIIVLSLGVFGLTGCGHEATSSTDTGPSVDTAVPDMGVADTVVAVDAGPDTNAPDLPVDTLCAPCTVNEDCGTDTDLCISVVAGESFCAKACDASLPCPTGYFCGVLDADAGVQQCVPDNLTCIDRCGGVSCAGTEVCDPLTGECRRPLRLCETGCSLDSLCGDGPEDICLTIPNTPDQERSCFTGCNPEAETTECPADYFCASLDPDNAPQRGVCYPFEQTCVDRCAAVDCPNGSNCDPVTGTCSPALYGPCEPGCTNSVQCGGQNDLCLNLGIGDAAHCWQDCSGGATCPSGYDCRNLLGSSLRLCIPLGNDCSSCYDNACDTSSVCDPIADTCEPLPQSCRVDGDCPGNELCDPISGSCVAIGRPCNGSTWAVDCDNAVTKCTSQRPGVDGSCQQLCVTDADCVTGSCVPTTLGNFCLGADLGGAATCGTLQAVGTNVGRSCSPGTCLSSAPDCVDGGNIEGFCSNTCTTDANCGSGQVCGSAVGETSNRCLPANCLCAGGLRTSLATESALGDELALLGLSQCAITFDASRYVDAPSVNGLVGESDAVLRLVEYPLAAVGVAQATAARLDQSTSVTQVLAAAASANGIALSPVVRTFSYPAAQRPLAQAIAELVLAGGGTPDLAALDTAVAGVPAAVGAAAAPLVSAVAVGVAARASTLNAAWGAGAQAQALFDGAPWILLPPSASQAAAALDPTVAQDAQLLRDGVEVANRLVAGADFLGQIADVAPALTSLGAQSFGTISIATPAGRVVIADSGNDLHDLAAHGSEIAVLIDLGGDDTYRVPAGANASLANGVSVLLDLGGADSYGYDIAADPNDGVLIPSDAAGRIAPTLPLNQANGPVSASESARQGAGRLGIGVLVDLGAGTDTYESLRMSQGASVLGLGLLYDDGPANFRAEALAQGAALGGLAVLVAAGNASNDYLAWHAAQGFGALGGLGVAYDRGGDDVWTADPGAAGTVLYLSAADRGVSNANLAQGVGYGIRGKFAGGLGLLRDAAGSDAYSAGTFAQGFGSSAGAGAVVDGGGDDEWNARGLAQGVGEWRGGGILRDEAGDDRYNPTSTLRLVGQGVGQTLGWGVFADFGGADTLRYFPSGGGVGLDGGFGLALSSGGADSHTSGSDATWGVAQINVALGEPGFGQQTIGIFLDTGGDLDTYMRPTLTNVGNDEVWSPMTNPPIYARAVDN